MQINIQYGDTSPEAVAIHKAHMAYSASNPGLTQDQFVKRMFDGMLGGLIKEYVRVELSSIELQKRFTQAERIRIRAAAETNPLVADYKDLLASTPVVSLTSDLLVEGLQALEDAGLLDYVGRAAEIRAL